MSRSKAYRPAPAGSPWPRRAVRVLAWVTVASLAGALPAAGDGRAADPEAGQVDAGFEIERFSWIGQAGEGKAVTIRNAFGDVRTRFGGYEGRVEVLATLQQLDDDGSRLEVEAKQSASGVAVTVGFRDPATDRWVTDRRPEHRKRADVVVFVPLGSALSVSTDHGLVQVRGTRGSVRARTVSGEIELRKVEGSFELETESGSILVWVGDKEVGGRSSMISRGGDQAVVLSADANVTVRVATGGLISTDFSLHLEDPKEGESRKMGEAVIGKGTAELVTSSESGHLRLQRRPVARKARARPGAGG